MTQRLHAAIRSEWEHSRSAALAGDIQRAFSHLERAHILSQRLTVMNGRTHRRMLAIGWRRRDAREILGQLSRTLAAACFSRIWVPLGNTGGANVSALKPMPLPPDLAAILRDQSTAAD